MATILLVEDDFNTRVGLSEILAGEGYDVEAVADGTSALNRLDSKMIALLLSDLRLPDISGLELHQRAKAVHPDLHTIIMTAFDTSSARRDAEATGVFSWLTKPLDVEHLLALVRDAVACSEVVDHTEPKQ